MTTTKVDPDSLPNDYDLPIWKTPSHYFGFDPVGDFVLYSQDPLSSVRTKCNYLDFFELMREAAKKAPEPPDGGDWVYDFRASHWGPGWVETLLLRRDAPDELQKEAAEIIGALMNYAVLDDSHLSEMEFEEAEGIWDSMDTREKAQACKHVGLSIFEARRELSEIGVGVSDLISHLRGGG